MLIILIATFVYVLSENRKLMMKIPEMMSQPIYTIIMREELVNSSRILHRVSTLISQMHNKIHSIIMQMFHADVTHSIKMQRLNAIITCFRAIRIAILLTNV